MNPRLIIAGLLLLGAAFAFRKAQAAQSQEFISYDGEIDFWPFDNEVPAYAVDIEEPQNMSFVLPPNPTRGERNNNPGNIEKSSSPWVGKIAGTDSRFESFETPEMGIRALAKLVRNYINDGHNTIDKIINRYAPSFENNSVSYASHVSQLTGYTRNQILFPSPDVVANLVNAIITHENGRNIYADSGIMERGISIAFA